MDEMGKKLRNQQIVDALSTNEEFLKAFVTATDAATGKQHAILRRMRREETGIQFPVDM